MTSKEKEKIKKLHDLLVKEVSGGNSYLYDVIISRFYMEFVSQLKYYDELLK